MLDLHQDAVGAVGVVGHDCGRLVLRLEHRLCRPLDEVWRALAPTVLEWTEDADTARWELGAVGGDTDVLFTAWIDSDDLDFAAGTAADYHVCFEQLVRFVDAGSVAAPRCADYRALASRYATAAAAALADTD